VNRNSICQIEQFRTSG